MKILDLFCGAGGSSMGYHRAFPDAEIVGVDIIDQPNYPFTFIRADATALVIYDDFDFIHASPPCQAFTSLRHTTVTSVDGWELPLVRHVLKSFGGPYVIENVPGAPLRYPVVLCGSMFRLETDGYALRRHRMFECSFSVDQPDHFHDEVPVLGVYGDLANKQRPSTRGVKASHQQARELMGIDWMTSREIVQAVPPAYTEYLGNSYRYVD